MTQKFKAHTPHISKAFEKSLSKAFDEQSGSYLASDVTLLLDIVDKNEVDDVPVTQKEALIQSGARHYSDMLTLEQAPSLQHIEYYFKALSQGTAKMARDINNLACTLHHVFSQQVSSTAPLILVSLVRAGLPIGVLLKRALADSQALYAMPCQHYGVSIIRDRGLDPVALHTILTRHPNSPIVFVDGWTGKGAIYGELKASLAHFDNSSHPHHQNIFHQGRGIIPLLTLADPAGVAWLAASHDDWLIPSGLLGSTVSGLISRTLYAAPAHDLKQGLHQSVIYHNLAKHDQSLAFINHINDARQAMHKAGNYGKHLATHTRPRFSTAAIIKNLADYYQIANLNRIKPTIAEATRAILRRDPEQVLLASSNHPDTALLRHLCEQKNIATQVAKEVMGNDILPYQAVTIIKKRD